MTDFHSGDAVGGEAKPVFHVCQTCASGGQALYDALKAQADLTAVTIKAVRCLAACGHGCAATLSMPGKWAWLLGSLTPTLAADLLCYADRYKNAATGTVMPSARPTSLRQSVLGRFPSSLVEMPSKERHL